MLPYPTVSIFFQLDLRSEKCMQLDAQCHLLGCAITRHLCQKETHHMLPLWAYDHQSVLVDLVKITTVSLLEKTVPADQTIPTVCLVVIICIKVPALLISLVETLHNSLQVPRTP